MNNVSLVGRLTRDPELRYTTGGVANCRFTLAVNRKYKNANGEREADFISCIAWRQTAELASNYLKKGSQVGITGNILTGSYEKDGQRIYTTDVVAEQLEFLDSKGSGQNQTQQRLKASSQGSSQAKTFADDGKAINFSDDDLPF